MDMPPALFAARPLDSVHDIVPLVAVFNAPGHRHRSSILRALVQSDVPLSVPQLPCRVKRANATSSTCCAGWPVTVHQPFHTIRVGLSVVWDTMYTRPCRCSDCRFYGEYGFGSWWLVCSSHLSLMRCITAARTATRLLRQEGFLHVQYGQQ
jgi:hypothetical protein